MTMSRPLRIEYEGAWYHVMNRGRRSDRIFESRNDYLMFLDLLKEAAELWDVRISACCPMSNHYHLLIHTPKGNLSRCMRHINGVYTQRFNRTHGCDGPLFRGRFKSILVDGDSVNDMSSEFRLSGYSSASSVLETMGKLFQKNQELHKRYEIIKNSVMIGQAGNCPLSKIPS